MGRLLEKRLGDRVKTSTTITYQDVCGSANYSLQLDEDLNDGKSSFSPGDIAHIRVYPGGHEFRPKLHLSMGRYQGAGSDSERVEDECITFSKSKEGSFGNYGFEPSYHWVGSYRCTDDKKGNLHVSIDNWGVTLNREVSGIMNVSYTAPYFIYQIFCNEIGKVLVEAEQDHPKYGMMYGSMTVDFGAESTLKACYVTIKDACTQAPIPGAQISIAGGVGSAVTDDNGRAYIGELQTGQNYGIIVSASGYQSSDQDRLHNDSIQISESSD